VFTGVGPCNEPVKSTAHPPINFNIILGNAPIFSGFESQDSAVSISARIQVGQYGVRLPAEIFLLLNLQTG
jgi:hypothetical protein